MKEDVLKELEIKRKEKLIGSALEADIVIHVKDPATSSKIAAMGDEAARFFQVATVLIADGAREGMRTYDHSSVSVTKTRGNKCVRCWNYYAELGEDPAHPELCRRCAAAVTIAR